MSQHPCLPVPLRRKREDGSQVDFSHVESMDAEEYIAAVVQEANALPDVFVADPATAAGHTQQEQYAAVDRKDHVPIDGSAASLNYLVSDRTSILPPPTKQHAPPSREWVDATLANFADLRAYLNRCQAEGVGGKGTERTPVPPLRNRPGWHVFCVGLDEARGNVASYYDEGVDSDHDDENEVPPWKDGMPPGGYPPTVRLLLQMDQVMVRRVLSHIVHYVSDGWSSSSKQRSAWIYALLARLDRPIHRDDAATLYGLLKELTASRAKLAPSKGTQGELARLNTLIAIVGLYFEQGGGYDNVMSFPDP